jgi:hypothetical protein
MSLVNLFSRHRSRSRSANEKTRGMSIDDRPSEDSLIDFQAPTNTFVISRN